MTAQARVPRVSVIVPARDAEATLERTLQSLRDQSVNEPFEVIVVDDGSRDATPLIAKRHEPFVKLIRNARSQGAGAARNRGAEIARAPVLAFTDADCFPTPHWLAAGLDAIADADLVQGAVGPDPTTPRTPFDRTVVVDHDRGFYQTANLLVRREVLDAARGFRDWTLEQTGWWRFSLDGPNRQARHRPVGEDTLFGWMACRTGARSAFAPNALVYHAVVPGAVRDAVADRWHWGRDMPGLARLVPELRRGAFHRRVFFNVTTAQFDLAVAGLLAALLFGRRMGLLATVPYVRRLGREAANWGPERAATFVLGTVAEDAATLAALLVGSVAARSIVL